MLGYKTRHDFYPSSWIPGFVHLRGFPGGSDSKESTCSAGDTGLIPGLGRSPGEGNGNTLQYSCLDRGAWQATVHGLAKSWTLYCVFETYCAMCYAKGNNDNS